jgi:hypothetical protein
MAKDAETSFNPVIRRGLVRGDGTAGDKKKLRVAYDHFYAVGNASGRAALIYKYNNFYIML